MFFSVAFFFLLEGKRLSKCQYDQMIAMQPEFDDMFIPNCMEDGSYKPIQCYEKHGIGKWCWCVDDSGLEIIGSKVENSGNAGNLTAQKCDDLRRNSTASDEYWTAFYRHSTASPLGTAAAAAATTTPKPILEINQSGE